MAEAHEDIQLLSDSLTYALSAMFTHCKVVTMIHDFTTAKTAVRNHHIFLHTLAESTMNIHHFGLTKVRDV